MIAEKNATLMNDLTKKVDDINKKIDDLVKSESQLMESLTKFREDVLRLLADNNEKQAKLINDFVKQFIVHNYIKEIGLV